MKYIIGNGCKKVAEDRLATWGWHWTRSDSSKVLSKIKLIYATQVVLATFTY